MMVLSAGMNDLSSVQVLRHIDDRLIAELERLLHDGAFDGAAGDATERVFFFVESDDFDFADFVGALHRFQNRRAVVAPQADEADDLVGTIW